MNANRGPLLILSAALFWNGAAAFYGTRSGGHFHEYSGNAGYIVAGALLLWGIIETARKS